ncbi:MAG: phosphopyruvate hydratase [Pseudomonadota bacterium]|jgi:enolase|nr:phosphopyruvate hydratase [Pseudomonadota bacterium]|tara:strand:+ start:1037 stop:2293 length:1257 start_codon:yes stop_codon:yes gene_type:complete
MKISKIKSIEILDSRARPTLCTTVYLDDGSTGQAMVPSGASTGQLEAYELRDKNDQRYGGLGVQNAVKNSEEALKILKGVSSEDQLIIDNKLIELDATENKSKLGANAILSVSLACARAASNSMSISLYEYLNIMYKGISNKNSTMSLPVPMLNIMNGGCHANNNVDIQEFMIIPSNKFNFKDGLMKSVEVYTNLKSLLKEKGLSVSVGDEGGFAPNLKTSEEVLDLIILSIERAGLIYLDDMSIALDCAASELFSEDSYKLTGENKKFSSDEMVFYMQALVDKYEIKSVEDPFDEKDWDAWKTFTKNNNDLQIVGDDIFVTQEKILRKGIDSKVANSILVKLNQVGTLSETMQAISLAKNSGYKTIISHRSGETEDSFIADLAVAVDAGQIKTGAPARSDRTAKYNRLLLIEDELYP